MHRYRPGPPLEEEFTFQAPTDPGVNTLKVYFSEVGDGSDINRAQPLDEWSYRVSRYRNSIEHLNPSEGHPSRAFGPFGAMHIATPPAPPLPAGFDFPGSPAAQLRSGWALPSFVRSLSDLADPQSGLGFLRLAHWSGLLDAPDTVATDGLFWRPRAPDLNVLLELGPDANRIGPSNGRTMRLAARGRNAGCGGLYRRSSAILDPSVSEPRWLRLYPARNG